MARSKRRCCAETGFTLVEILVTVVLLTVLGVLISSFSLSGTWLFAKNTSLNGSHTSARSELDRLADELQQAYNLPTLIDTSGGLAAAPSAGLQYDHFRGGPYVLQHPSGGFTAGTTTITVTYSLDPIASAPQPSPGDVLLVDTSAGTSVRGQISSVSGATSSSGNQTIDLNLSAPFGVNVEWDPTQPKTATLVRRRAFIVMPAGGRNELRFYQTFEPVPANLNDPTKYIVVTNQVSTQAGDATPFSIDATTGDKLVKASLRVRAEDYTNSLSNKQSNAFNTFVRIDSTLPSRLRPKG